MFTLTEEMKQVANDIARRACEELDRVEREVAWEWYGCSYEELDEDERGEVALEAVYRVEYADEED